MSRREQIRMTDEEVDAFLAETHTLIVASVGPDGRPHVVPMWYGFLDGAIAFWTYGRSQKVVNLRRDPRLTCLVEAGVDYAELRGVELVGSAQILDDPASVVAVGQSVFDRHTGPYTPEARPIIEQMGAKRVAVRIEVDRVVSWDHRKLGGTY